MAAVLGEMKIAGVSVDWARRESGEFVKGGTCHYRLALPLRELARHGYATTLGVAIEAGADGSLTVLAPDGARHDDCDVVVLQRFMGAEMAAVIKRARASGQRIVQDIDDYFWALPRHHYSARQLGRVDWNRDHYKRAIRVSDAAICSVPFLARALERWAPQAFVARNAIDLERWRPWDGQHFDGVAWIGATPWRADDLAVLSRVLAPFLADHGLPFWHIGHVPNLPEQHWVWNRLGIKTEVHVAPVIPFDEYPSAWPDAIIVIPLEDVAFNRAKSWLRGLECSARGLPFVASGLPEYEALGAGRLAKRPREWREQLEMLLDPEIRRFEALCNRRRAEELSIERQWEQWARIFDEIGAA